MDIALAIKALILGIVEGLTEFLPISSTGHLILAGQLLDFNDEKGKIFEIVIQFGAILAVCWEFRHKIIDVIKGLPNDPRQQRFAINVIVATIPAITLALIFGKAIKAHLFNPIVVASAFIIGGFVILWAEWRERHRGQTHDPRANALLEAAKAGAPRIETLDDLRISDAIKVGLAQCFALIPGTSRSGSTIIGGLLFGLSRKVATEFSFFLAMPTMAGAFAFDLMKNYKQLSADNIVLIAIGFVAAFLAGLVVVKKLLDIVSNYGFKPFAYWRIIVGSIGLALVIAVG